MLLLPKFKVLLKTQQKKRMELLLKIQRSLKVTFLKFLSHRNKTQKRKINQKRSGLQAARILRATRPFTISPQKLSLERAKMAQELPFSIKEIQNYRERTI